MYLIVIPQCFYLTKVIVVYSKLKILSVSSHKVFIYQNSMDSNSETISIL